MRRQFLLLCCAVQLLTRLPVPPQADFMSDRINRSARYFPLVGQLVGVISAAILLLAAQLWSGWLPSILAVLAAVFITGALHEDGLADTADGLGGGRDAAHRLAIMKDSRTGTFGVLSLVFCTAIKLASLAAMAPWAAAAALVAGHGAARAATVVVMNRLPYAGDPGSAKLNTADRAPTSPEVFIALALTAWPLLLLGTMHAAFGLLICGLLTFTMAATALRLIGGQRGDVLGAVEQLCEAGFLLGCAARFGHAL